MALRRAFRVAALRSCSATPLVQHAVPSHAPPMPLNLQRYITNGAQAIERDNTPREAPPASKTKEIEFNSEVIKQQMLAEMLQSLDVEREVFVAQIPSIIAQSEAEETARYLSREKHRKDFKDYEAIEKLFYYYAANGDHDKAMIAYLDYKAHSRPPKLMSQLMMLEAGINNDLSTLRIAYNDMNAIKNIKWSKAALTLAMKSFARFGDVSRLLQCYYKLYEFGHLPEEVHWTAVVEGAIIAGDYRNFSRFFVRLNKKLLLSKKSGGISVLRLRSLLTLWGTHENFNWKMSKECNTHLYDLIYAMKIFLRVRNYKRAFQFLLVDIERLNMALTPQAIEMLLSAVKRDYPKLNQEVRVWKDRMRNDFKAVDEATRKDFKGFINFLTDYIGADNLEYAPRMKVKKVKTKMTRKEARRRNRVFDEVKAKSRYTSQFTDESNLFEYAPEFKRKLDNLAAEKAGIIAKKAAEKEIDEEIEEARKKFRDWRRTGFEGDFAYNPRSATKELEAKVEAAKSKSDHEADI